MSDFLLVLRLGILSLTCLSMDLHCQNAATLLIDAELISISKSQIEKKDASLMPAFAELIADAKRSMNEGPFSVTHKEKLAPSGDDQDYASYSRYWWPDPNKTDGLPYVRRDGETNPASQSPDESDRPRIGALSHNCETLGLAYYFTGEEQYANKVAELLRVWFLDSKTRMNPNLKHAQCRPGHNEGSKSGVLDGRLMISALEASLLIAESGALSDAEQDGLRKWAADYFDWLTNNPMALEEAASKNNHGSFYDVQAIYFALFAGKTNDATAIAERFLERRVLKQIEPDGSMPKELARTRPLFYSIYNLHAMLLVAQLCSHLDVDVLQAEDEKSRLRCAIDYLVPYADPLKNWPQPTVGELDKMDLFAILQMAQRAYPDGGYLQVAEQLPLEKRRIARTNLVFPLMR